MSIGERLLLTVFAFSDNEVRIYTTTISATNRMYTLMHDPNYRLGAAMVLQRKIPTSHPGFYLGPAMPPPPRPRISTVPGLRDGRPHAVAPKHGDSRRPAGAAAALAAGAILHAQETRSGSEKAIPAVAGAKAGGETPL